jgi:translation elongation factor EF-G
MTRGRAPCCTHLNPIEIPQAGGESIMMIALEPLKPAELPKMVEGLSHVSKAYPMATTCMERARALLNWGTIHGLHVARSTSCLCLRGS